MSFETGFRVLSVTDGSLLTESPQVHEGHSIGWIGSRCVVFLQGKDIYDALKQESKVFHVVTKQVRSLSAVAGPAAAVVRPYAVQWPYAVSRDEGGSALHTLTTPDRSRRLARGASVRILPVAAGSLPEFCR